MQRVQRVRAGLVVSTVLLVLFLGQLHSNAQTVSENEVKAAYLYNFAKFVEWPAHKFANSSAPFQFCVMDDESFQEELSRFVQNKTVAGRPVNVVGIKSGGEPSSCHILFVKSPKQAQAREAITMQRATNVLTVGQNKDFVAEGGIINFILENDRIRFEVNHRAAKEAGLRISARLLTVAKLVVE